MAALQLVMNENLFLRDPQDTELGRKIIRESIKMIDELGLEDFTFKKLASHIGSTEASVYRYFENKHRLLIYLIAWYWNWLEYKIDYNTHNIQDPQERLKLALHIITEKKTDDPLFPDINEEALYRIVILESDKTYLTKHVDDDNKEGLFRGYKALCNRIATFILGINPKFAFSHTLVSTVLQASHQQIFYSEHLPSLTELNWKKDDVYQKNYEFLLNLILKAIK